LTAGAFQHTFSNRESIDLIATEYGIAYLTGRTVRERALALIDIAHPGDREKIFDQAKKAKLMYSDQIYYVDSEHLYPDHLSCIHTFKDNLMVRFRAIKSSDEDEMRRLFYRFSDQAVYYRYFSPIKTMPHTKMQEYVNVDYSRIMSIVGVIDAPGAEKIIAEARYVRQKDNPFADTAFIVDEDYQGRGIASFLFDMLIRVAKENGIEGFMADVLVDNKAMLKVYEKAPYTMKAQISGGVYELSIPFTETMTPGIELVT
jgi:RimJ/RimL family protein N-acetyltransferase